MEAQSVAMDFSLGPSPTWKEGRRVVELQELAQQMRCKNCKALLDLNLTIKETRQGLASVLYIMCQCGMLNDVHTGRKQDSDGSGRPVYHVNLKASITMFMCGLEAQNVINILQMVLEVPVSLSDDTLLVVPNQPAADVAASAPVTMTAYNPPLNTPLPAQLQMPQPEQIPQQQQQVLNIPQHKEVCRAAHAVHGTQPVSDVQTVDRKKVTSDANKARCVHCQACPHHSPTTSTNPPPPSLPQKSPQKVKLTKDERDDLKINTKCTVCKIVFRTREHYRMHKILHPQVRKKQRIKCPDCSAEFPDRSKLREHAKIHSGATRDKPFKCELCDKSFFKKSQRSKHIKRCHMKENSHICNICGKRTFTKSEMREHIRIHTGERPYQCEVCDRTFRRKDYLTVHMRQHTGVKPYGCLHCGEAFVQKVSLCKHLQTKHAVGTTGAVPVSLATPVSVPASCSTVGQQSIPSSLPISHNSLFYQSAL